MVLIDLQKAFHKSQYSSRKTSDYWLFLSNNWLVCWQQISVHFGEDKTKSILFANKYKIKSIGKLDITYINIKIKQYSAVTYLGCVLDETVPGDLMTLKKINKINLRLWFLYRKNNVLTPPLCRLLCNALFQPYLDYACFMWYPNLTIKLKKKLQISHSKCIRFCLKVNTRKHIYFKEFHQLNWLLIDKWFKQCISATIFKYLNPNCPAYLDEVFEAAPQNILDLKNSYKKLKQPFRTTTSGQNAISFIGPSVWNILPKELKSMENLNTFKHKLKEHYLNELETQNK